MQSTLPFETGLTLRDAALALHEDKSGDFLEQARRVFIQILLKQDVASADDLRTVMTPPDGTDPRVFGAIVMALSRLKLIERAGYIQTANKKAHARPLAVWKLADRTKAIEWLK